MGTVTQFIVFVSIVFSVYGLMNYYVCRKILLQTHFPTGVNAAIIAFLILMVVSPFICRIGMFRRMDGFHYGLTLVSSLWMGVLFYLLILNAGVDLVNALGRLIGWIIPGTSPNDVISPGYPIFFIILIVTSGICTYGYFEALNIGVSRVTIETHKLPRGVDRVTIAQISDVHLGVLVGESRLKKIARIIEELHPDILISTGDLVDENLDSMDYLAEELKSIRPRLGKYAITGNHEFYAGLERSVRFTEDSGFIMLRNQYANVHGIINLIGLDDPTAKNFNDNSGEGIPTLFSRCDPELFTILLRHQPRAFKKNASSMPMDLQLSGHTHKGQIFPFNLLTHILFPLQGGFFEVDGKKLYSSRGTGTWGPPLRFLSPPEIVIIELRKL
ncbi:MAG: metallophosphoesterase [Thermodesulfobacteriota bacterium]|nr:metallophosphoesterase [Thermodesulfobacteriota bacterium]